MTARDEKQHPRKQSPQDVIDADKDYNMLSLADLLAARDQYHLHLTAKKHVVGTAVGRYLIRKSDPWPRGRQELVARDTRESGAAPKKVPRTLANSELRPYSWPCVIVFVDTWVDETDLAAQGLTATDIVPKALSMPDGSRVPVCVVWAPLEDLAPPAPIPQNFPKHWVGGGFPILIDTQGEERVASIGCLVTDGHTVYALTNRHVTGEPNTPVYTMMGGEKCVIGKSSRKQLVSKRFEEVYPGWEGKRVYVNLDIGLIEIDDINQWTAQVYGIGRIGKLADLSAENISLRLIDCPVKARGAVSGRLSGRIKGLFYRYKAVGGFEYVSDCLIGPADEETPLTTRPGDSGTLWLLDAGTGDDPMPVAVQWGGQRFLSEGRSRVSPYALATFLSTACLNLEVEPIRDWNLGDITYWGAVGHYTIAAKAIEFLSDPDLKNFMEANLERVSFAAAEISKKTTTGLSTHAFVPLADVPDLVWKLAKHENGGRGQPEHPNHFADMDAENAAHQTLLELCEKSDDNVAVKIWQNYYTEVKDQSRGLLPFRVWQFYNFLVAAISGKSPGAHGKPDFKAFLCAAGTLAHYVGDACQPLHISHLFDGDPADSVEELVRDRQTGQKVKQMVPRAHGVHSAYENDMVNYHVIDIVKGIDAKAEKVKAKDMFKGGHNSALAVVGLMQKTFAALPPPDIVHKFQELKDQGSKPKEIADGLWSEFGDGTIDAMVDGCACLARIWQSAWIEGGGDKASGVPSKAIAEQDLAKLYKNQDFVRSFTLDSIAPHLT